MARDLLPELFDRIEDELDGLTLAPDGLRAVVDGRFGEVTVAVEHDPEEEMLRISAAVPPPAGTGRSFLVWCLALNAKYWDVKMGLDSAGRLLVHSDLDAEDDADIDDLAAAVVERADAVVDLLDDDLVEWLLDRDLGTPGQRE
ncbi:MAG TPA: hypothetical protein RMG45_08275, partial [Polyangiaceae bacterium LLY-WYZ-15_(1-7)]|nr:hypothetical protein [Polyangiaceae bacterium LLY-WYZ-15_(1-7)]